MEKTIVYPEKRISENDLTTNRIPMLVRGVELYT